MTFAPATWFHTLRSRTQALRGLSLWRKSLLFAGLDAVFLSYGMAYGYQGWGVQGVLFFLMAQYTAGLFGYRWVLQDLNQGGTSSRLLSGSVKLLTLFLGAASVAHFASPVLALSVLALTGGMRGACWAAKMWEELHLTHGPERETYFSLLNAGSTSLRMAMPLLVGLVLLATGDQAAVVFGLVSLGGLALWRWMEQGAAAATPLTGELALVETVRNPAYWRSAAFYLSEGAGSSLRQALYVSGVLAVVGQASTYAFVDGASAALGVAVLAVLASRTIEGPSIARLQWSMGMAAVGWLCLWAALWVPLALTLFVAFNALSTPVLAATKSSLVLKGLKTPQSSPANAMWARELLMWGARLSALALAGWVAGQPDAARVGLVLAVGLILVLMPLEYVFASRIARQAN